MKLPEIILFDLDGTLIDSSEVVIDAYYNALIKYDLPLKSREFIGQLMGRSTIETAKGLGVPEDKHQFIDDFFWEYFGNYARELKGFPVVFDGVKRLLEIGINHGIRFGVCTSNEASNAEILLNKANLAKYFEVFVGSEHPVNKKPSGEPLMFALKKMDYPLPLKEKTQVWFIGDTEFDIAAAKQIGAFSVGIAHPSTKKALIIAEPDILTESMEALSSYFSDHLWKTNNNTSS